MSNANIDTVPVEQIGPVSGPSSDLDDPAWGAPFDVLERIVDRDRESVRSDGVGARLRGRGGERDCGVVEVQQRVHVQLDLDWLVGGHLRPVDHAPGRVVRPGIRFRDGGFGGCGLV